jgi:hypothetical protein
MLYVISLCVEFWGTGGRGSLGYGCVLLINRYVIGVLTYEWNLEL